MQKEWLDHLDQAKKAILAREKVKRESSQTGPAANEEPINIDSPTTLFDEESIFPNLNLPDWFLESPEEIDVFIAERHFEDALELLNKCKEYCDGLDEQQKDSVVIDIKYV